jgi:hypothetical protein
MSKTAIANIANGANGAEAAPEAGVHRGPPLARAAASLSAALATLHWAAE